MSRYEVYRKLKELSYNSQSTHIAVQAKEVREIIDALEDANIALSRLVKHPTVSGMQVNIRNHCRRNGKPDVFAEAETTLKQFKKKDS